MVIFRIPIVIPTQWKWVALFFVIGFFGYGAQVGLGRSRSPEDVI